jgi:Ca-activated chloride channel family protein
VAALWARARIAELLDAQRRGADAQETRSEIVTTALRHHLVSKHTSLVAVDKTPVRPAGDQLAREQVPNLMAHGQSGRAIFGFPATATDGPALRKSGLLTLLAALLILMMSAWQRKVHRGLAH